MSLGSIRDSFGLSIGIFLVLCGGYSSARAIAADENTTDPLHSAEMVGFSNPLGGPDNGFLIYSADKANTLRFTGQIQGDYRGFQADSYTADLRGFFLRRARFGLEATLAKYFEFRFMPDFGKGQCLICLSAEIQKIWKVIDPQNTILNVADYKSGEFSI